MNTKLKNWAVPLFFFCILALGLMIFGDYGISWDEKVERIDGAVTLSYVEKKIGIEFPGLPEMLEAQNYHNSLELHSYKDRYYPVGFNYPAELLIRLFGLVDDRDAYLLRHLMTFLVAYLGVIALFYLAKERFKSWKIGILAVTLFLISPRFFAESFFNSKDIVLWAFFTIATLTLIRFVIRPNWVNLFLHSIATALALNIRLLAIVMVFITAGILLIRCIKKEISIVELIKFFGVYVISISCMTTLMWPLLWDSPLKYFIDAFKFMAKYGFYQETLYFGKVISSTNLPWHYLPLWIAITTPIFLLVYWFIGAFQSICNLYVARFRMWRNEFEMQDIIFLAIFLCPIAGVIIFHSVIYDGWRHLYFIYTGFLLISVKGMVLSFDYLKRQSIFKRLFVMANLILVGASIIWMIRAHPYQNVYFNNLIGSNWIRKFDVDYWGLANVSAFKRILDKDDRKRIFIKDGAYNFLPLSLSMLKPQERERLFFTADLKQADYIITNYRLNQTDYESIGSCWKLFSNIKVGNELISSTYKNVKDIVFASAVRGDKLFFSSKNEGACLLGHGWSNPESWGVWADSPKSFINIPANISGIKKITFDFKALIGGGIKNQKIIISINGLNRKEYTLTNFDANLITYYFPDFLERNNAKEVNVIEIESLNPISPTDIGIGRDDRKLSIGLVSVVFQ